MSTSPPCLPVIWLKSDKHFSRVSCRYVPSISSCLDLAILKIFHKEYKLIAFYINSSSHCYFSCLSSRYFHCHPVLTSVRISQFIWKPIFVQHVKVIYLHILIYRILDVIQIYYEQNVGMYCMSVICSPVLRECNFDLFSLSRGTRWCSWLRHCATSRFDSRWRHWIFFIDIILPALGLTQPLTEMSTRNISWGVKAAVA